MTRGSWGRPAYIFDVPGRPRATIIFYPYRDLSSARVIESVRSHFDNSIPSDYIAVLVLYESLAHSLVDSDLIEYLRKELRHYDEPSVNIAYPGTDGSLLTLVGNDGTVTKESDLNEKVQWGIRLIFDERGGFLDARDAYHYGKPSGRHSDRFIRTANVLINDVEVAFVALGIAILIGMRRPSAIYVDTAGIGSVAMWVRTIVDSVGADGQGASPVVIDSFSSYGGLENEELALEQSEDALFLISASTSGGLVKKLGTLGIVSDPNRVVTIFYGGPKETEGLVLCDLTEEQSSISFDPVLSYDSDACTLCERGVPLVGIAGDQFLPAEPVVKGTIIGKGHKPPWFGDSLRFLIGSGIVRCYGGTSGSSPRTRELYFDLHETVASLTDGSVNEFGRVLRDRILTRLPVACAGIVPVDQASSHSAAISIAKLHREACGGEEEPPVIQADEADLEARFEGRQGSVLVVASASVSGRSLLSAAQRLREVASRLPLIYLICINRPSSRARWQTIRSNLGVGRTGDVPHEVVPIFSVFVPDDLQSMRSPWVWELDQLTNIEEWHRLAVTEDYARSVEGLIEERRKQLVEPGVQGLTDGCFLPKRVDNRASFRDRVQRLILRPDFVFWQGIDYADEKYSQAEAYLTIASVLHWLRTESTGSGHILLVHEHNHNVLSPLTFSRFNDGILQACFLRSAHPVELDYRSSDEMSALMRDILLDCFSSPGAGAGEAANEFLLALACQRLRLKSRDENEIKSLLQPADLDEYGSMLNKYWQEADVR